MSNYIDYMYYAASFGGNLIPSEKFAFYCTKATQYIRTNTFGNIDENNITEEIKMCCAEICDVIYKSDIIQKPVGITSEKVGEMTINYESEQSIKETQGKEMNKILKLWLADTGLLYRGV